MPGMVCQGCREQLTMYHTRIKHWLPLFPRHSEDLNCWASIRRLRIIEGTACSPPPSSCSTKLFMDPALAALEDCHFPLYLYQISDVSVCIRHQDIQSSQESWKAALIKRSRTTRPHAQASNVCIQSWLYCAWRMRSNLEQFCCHCSKATSHASLHWLSRGGCCPWSCIQTSVLFKITVDDLGLRMLSRLHRYRKGEGLL